MDLLDDDSLLDLRGRARRTDPAAVTAEERGLRSESRPDETNPDLRDWMASSGIEQAVPDDPEKEGDDACHICKERAPKYTCKQCGRGSCAAHHWVMFGLCHRCATEDRVQRWNKESHPETDNWLDLGGPGVRP